MGLSTVGCWSAGFVLGYRSGRGVGSVDNRHALTVAGSRGGKRVSLIVPNLLMYDGSVLAIEPKDEMARRMKRLPRARACDRVGNLRGRALRSSHPK